MRGNIFDIEEFAVFDGPGIRNVVFLKGCPLRCNWCHNPEGLSTEPQRMKAMSLCKNCGVCDIDSEYVCPNNALSIVGETVETNEVIGILKKHKKLLEMNEGGITFSGGEPLMQPEFIIEICRGLEGLHKCIETSGYADIEIFKQVIEFVDLVIMDIKVVDNKLHKKYTGVSNKVILENLEYLKSSGKEYIIRIPIIPNVNDTMENIVAIANLLKDGGGLQRVELLPYNKVAGAKYLGLGMKYEPCFPVDKEPNIFTEPLSKEKLSWTIL